MRKSDRSRSRTRVKTERSPNDALSKFADSCRSRTEAALDRWLPPSATTPRELHQAMRYAALSGGKYIRPLLVYAAGQACSVTPQHLDGPACAVELIHAYSLIHDDLPAMDNDQLRRGRATCHVAFGEAVAILAGDALQALSFHILAGDPGLAVSDHRRLKMIDTLSLASSSLGMAGGQAIDLAAVGKELSIEELEGMHLRKTGALIRAAVLLGALSNEAADERALQALGNYARCIGLAFQIRDDILDVEGSTATLGKTQGSDRANDKPTYPALLGIGGAQRKAETLHEEALGHLSGFGPDADTLRAISEYIVQRMR